MAEYFASMSSEELSLMCEGLCCFILFLGLMSLQTWLHNFCAVIYCRRRQRKTQTTRCYFWDCPVWTNCPYNATPPNKKQSFKEWLQSWRKKGGEADV